MMPRHSLSHGIPLPDASVLLSTLGHAPLDLGGIEMPMLPSRHGGLHLSGTHPLERLGHLRLGVILRVASLNVGQQVGEGSTFVGKLGSPTDLAGDGLAPLSIVVAFCATINDVLLVYAIKGVSKYRWE